MRPRPKAFGDTNTCECHITRCNLDLEARAKVPPICQNIAPDTVVAGTSPSESAQKMNGTSILVERLYTV
jgi:hypothetical protein